MNQTGGNGEKHHFGPNLHPLGPNSGPHFFFFFSKMWLRQSLDIMISYHHVQHQKKLKIQTLVTDERTNRQTDESDFIGCCPTNAECPTVLFGDRDPSWLNRNNKI